MMASTNAKQTDSDDDTAPALGARENWWGEDVDGDGDDIRRGHEELTGTDAAEYIAHQLLLNLVAPVCGNTGIELSDPCFHLPKQVETTFGYVEYRQHRHRRRINPETGMINWGESTSTDVPEFGEEVFEVAVHNYLANRLAQRGIEDGDGLTVTNINDYLHHADALWHDPQFSAIESLEQLVRHVRECESPDDN